MKIAESARSLLLPSALALTLWFAPPEVHAQQFVTDDAAIVDFRTCQLEAWYGRLASWILPTCHFVPNLDLTAGVGFVAGGPGRRSAEFVVQGKYLFREMSPDGLGVGLVAGFGMDPLAQASDLR